MTQRLLVISPVRNEQAHLAGVGEAMGAQTRPPDAWVVVDDGSTDATAEILGELQGRLGFLTVLGAGNGPAGPAPQDRLATGAAPRAFNRGLNSLDWESFTHIAKLDGDTELPPRYFELLLERFARDGELGLAGGVRVERDGEREILERVPENYHVPGALKCYTRECLQAIGGMPERLAWDTIDEVCARMHGFRTRSFPDLVAVHHRPWGSADGQLRGRARHGRCAYIVYYPLAWTLLRAVKTARMRPVGLSGLAYLGGYLGAGARRTPRVEDPEFRRFFRRELRERARGALRARLRRAGRSRPAGPRASTSAPEAGG